MQYEYIFFSSMVMDSGWSYVFWTSMRYVYKERIGILRKSIPVAQQKITSLHRKWEIVYLHSLCVLEVQRCLWEPVHCWIWITLPPLWITIWQHLRVCMRWILARFFLRFLSGFQTNRVTTGAWLPHEGKSQSVILSVMSRHHVCPWATAPLTALLSLTSVDIHSDCYVIRWSHKNPQSASKLTCSSLIYHNPPSLWPWLNALNRLLKVIQSLRHLAHCSSLCYS